MPPPSTISRTSSSSSLPRGIGGTPTMMTEHAPSPQPGESRVKVCCRVRPVSVKERGGSNGMAVKVVPHDITSLTVTGASSAGRTTQRYSMDRVFGEEASQTDVFEEIAAPLVKAACAGAHAALFAYGQTGSGKTHSMLGLDVWQLFATRKSDMTVAQRQALERSEQRGVIPRAMQLVFELLRDRQHKVAVSYLEIYNEKIFDLLGSDSPPSTMMATPGGSGGDKGLEIREDKAGQIQVINATLRRVHSLDEVMDTLWRGAKNRSVGSTDVNEHSSRSHTIFQVVIETRATTTQRGTKAKLNLVDLAGSEKWRPHQLQEFTEQRLLEMTSINQSLSNLGQCVRGLLQPGRHHIPYRNSKLTRLLQDALGGNAQLGFIVCVSPAETSFDETVSTLQFADRAKRIVVRDIPSTANVATTIVEPPMTLLERLRARQEDGGDGNENHGPALQSYHEFLRSRTVDTLTPLERLTLLEWSILVQAEELERTRTKYQQDLEKAKVQQERLKQMHEEDNKDKDAEMERLKAEVKAALAEAKARATQVAELKSAQLGTTPRAPSPNVAKSVGGTQQLPSSSSGYQGKAMTTTTTTTNNSENIPRDNRIRTSEVSSSPSLLSTSFRSSRFSSPAAVLQHKTIASSPALSGMNGRATTTTTTLAVPVPSTTMWESFIDPKSKRPYYYCKSTGVTQWTRPDGFVDKM